MKILEEPVLTQIRLRNIFEIAFDNLERGTQRERYAALKGAFPTALDNFFFCRRTESESETSLPLGGGFEYTLRSLYDLYLLELNLYFQQDKQRIARCEYCWGYFVPALAYQPMMCLDLGQGADAQWQYFSAEDLARQDQDSAASLREKYGRDGSAT